MSDQHPSGGLPERDPSAAPRDDFPAHAASGIHSEPEYLDSSTPAPDKKKKGAAIVAASALALLAVGGGTYAWTQFNGGGAHPYEKLADGAFFYVQTNTNPTAEQKLAINDLAKKFPEIKDEEGYSVLTAENFNGALLAEALETDEKYEYMGDRMALAAYPDANDDGDPEFALIAQVNDEAAAEGALKDLLAKAKEEDEPLKGEVKDGYLMATSGDLETVFPDGAMLTDNEEFTDAMDEVQGNAFSGWADLSTFSDAMKESQAAEAATGFTTSDVDEVELEGTMSFGLKVRKDGVDLITYGEGVKTNGETLTVAGDQSATADLLNSIAYDDALFNLGVTGLGEFAQQALESSGEDISTEGLPVTNEDVPALLGDKAAVSVRFSGGEDISGKLVLAGIDQAKLDEVLQSQGLTVEQAEAMLQQEFGEDVTVELSEGELVAVMGDEPEGSGDFDSGTVMGSVDLDQVAALFSAFSMEEDTPEDLGVISFSAEVQDGGDSKAVLGWTTPR